MITFFNQSNFLFNQSNQSTFFIRTKDPHKEPPDRASTKVIRSKIWGNISFLMTTFRFGGWRPPHYPRGSWAKVGLCTPVLWGSDTHKAKRKTALPRPTTDREKHISTARNRFISRQQRRTCTHTSTYTCARNIATFM